MEIREFQEEQNVWSLKNFGKQDADKCLFGLMEELGEIAHSWLKMKQGIRGDAEFHMANIKDGCADLFVFLMGFCNSLEMDAQEEFERVWSEVKLRDWTKNKENGIGE